MSPTSYRTAPPRVNVSAGRSETFENVRIRSTCGCCSGPCEPPEQLTVACRRGLVKGKAGAGRLFLPLPPPRLGRRNVADDEQLFARLDETQLAPRDLFHRGRILAQPPRLFTQP